MRLDGGSGPAATVAVATEVAAEVKEAAAEVVTAAEAMEVAVVEATEEEEKVVDYSVSHVELAAEAELAAFGNRVRRRARNNSPATRVRNSAPPPAHAPTMTAVLSSELVGAAVVSTTATS